MKNLKQHILSVGFKVDKMGAQGRVGQKPYVPHSFIHLYKMRRNLAK